MSSDVPSGHILAMTDKVKAAFKALEVGIGKKLDEKSKSDVLELLSELEGELEGKDIAIATLKSECLKHLLHNLRSDKSLLCDPVLALNRDSVKTGKSSNSTLPTAKNSGKPLSSKSSISDSSQNDQTVHKLVALYNLVESQKSTLQRLTSCLSEADKQRTALLRDLEEERLKNVELTKKSKEYEQKQALTEKKEIDESDPQTQTDSSSDPEEHKKLQATLTTERQNTKDMILVLMEDRRKMASLYMEEKKRSDDLNRQLREEKSRVRALGMGLEEESKRSLAMEAELERHLVQINSQSEELQKHRINAKDLEDALRKARADAEHFKKQLSEAHRVAMSQASAAAAPLYAAHNDVMSVGNAGSPGSGTGNATSSSSISSSSTSVSGGGMGGGSMGGLTASSLVTAAIGKQTLGLNYEVYSSSTQQQQQPVAKSRSSISSTATMVPRGSHRVVPNLTNVGASIVSDTSMSSTITRITNSFQVNGVGPPKKGAGPPVPPNKPTVSIYKPLSKLEGIVNSADARSGAIDLAK